MMHRDLPEVEFPRSLDWIGPGSRRGSDARDAVQLGEVHDRQAPVPRGDLAAGPSTLVLTVCPVDPDSSLELTYRFHQGLTGGAGGPAQALARAQRTLAAEGEPVHCWSPFVVFGLG